MSTLSSLVLASSSTLTIDFIKDNLVKNMSEKKQVFVMRIFVVVFIAISAVIAIVQYNSSVSFIAQLMGISWGALAELSSLRSFTVCTPKRSPRLRSGSALSLAWAL